MGRRSKCTAAEEIIKSFKFVVAVEKKRDEIYLGMLETAGSQL